jgi:two-component system, chemotaxis family, chemotaxis protein CheY
MRALIVDDSRTMRAIIGRTVKEIGFEVLEAGNGREALEQLHKNGAVELSLVDWHMPIMSGIDFVRAVRAEHSFDSMKVMMVTTAADCEHVSAALDAGANEYLMKPFNKETILSKLQMLGVVQS